ncbi:adenylate/guanylate cyclase domain-containing protein [Lichenihabitans sp. Uapishka_5]|uniref:adenylate/guanylate cyclase domain-containing protein n=1 Tax=Lichenihabitans sp. Uapishka_5 TaxID=3037302 RepID=UPI0029E80B7F|nr:adenylate/guanylate cyclase domain-containing protein [Lichenihabitans sp. Uapishka_5]MDX7951607.1 adenylate/guanylate cyclase domain-containing protein [Lichenihabitans sp. Uapishka_5]
MPAGRAIPFLLAIALFGAGSGLLYTMLAEASSYWAGAIYGGCIALCISGFERGLILGGFQTKLRRWPTPIFIPVMEAMTVLLALVGFVIGGTACWQLGLSPGSWVRAAIPTPVQLLYALLIGAVLVTLTRVRDLLGHEVFTSLLLGRYHKPVEERRIFLFLDVVGSTAFARQHGDLRAQAYLGAIFAAIAAPVLRHKGAIDDYVGDMVMITWPEARGLAEARCAACVFAILDAIEAERDTWIRRFGQVPRFHAALHGGSIVTAEVGVDRHKISYFGDVVNTTARIESLCRPIGSAALISSDLLHRLPALPPGVAATWRGDHLVKGHEQPFGVFSLERAPATALTNGECLLPNQQLGPTHEP